MCVESKLKSKQTLVNRNEHNTIINKNNQTEFCNRFANALQRFLKTSNVRANKRITIAE